MKKTILSVLGLLCLILTSGDIVNAQTTSIGISTEMSSPKFASNTMNIDIIPGVDIPINFVDFGDASNLGFGISANIQQTFANERAAIIAKAGVINYKVADQGLLQATVKAIPITVGGRAFIYDGFYAGADVGATMVTSKLKATFLLSLADSQQETLFTFSPNIGYQLDLGNAKVDIGAKYALVGGKFNNFGITAGVNLPIGK